MSRAIIGRDGWCARRARNRAIGLRWPWTIAGGITAMPCLCLCLTWTASTARAEDAQASPRDDTARPTQAAGRAGKKGGSAVDGAVDETEDNAVEGGEATEEPEAVTGPANTGPANTGPANTGPANSAPCNDDSAEEHLPSQQRANGDEAQGGWTDQWTGYARAEHVRDSDEDGIPDYVERATGTNPFREDTDRDSVSDGHEDRNLDGIVDPGESDPRVPGLFPGSFPHIPEPLVFDLVRGLGAKRGELEFNTLALLDARRGTVEWAPEVEWAFADGYAIELELPTLDRNLEAVKVALQGTLPAPRWDGFTHGWQVFAEVGLDAGHTDIMTAYIFGQRFKRRWSYLAMLGSSTEVDDDGIASVSGIANLSFFVDTHEWQTWGLETNTSYRNTRDWGIRVIPQVHLQASKRVRFQFGAGAELRRNEVIPLLAMRGIIE